ncbi:S26 family signal peptidase [Pseudarthrobacter sp. N5]|uniref:S26 family signal peptidase n=1 Tax=Pseudarthrobacter sp. N5 TaxID=3418416 RepID=UPI003CEAD899
MTILDTRTAPDTIRTPPPRRRGGAWRRGAVVVLAAILGILLTGALLFSLAGGRWFVISTPSMAEAAPVGTLVLTFPEPAEDIRAGDVVTFHPPTAPDQTYTHRVRALTAAGGILTRGDLNGADDPWTLTGGDLVGKSITVPGLGWLIRALPILIPGIAGLWILTGRFVPLSQRIPLRIVGVPLVISVATIILRPFIGISILAAGMMEGTPQATVVSTGMLPISVHAEGGDPAHLTAGSVGQVPLPSLDGTDHYQMASALDLPPAGWILLMLICALPLLWSLACSLPGLVKNRSTRT